MGVRGLIPRGDNYLCELVQAGGGGESLGSLLLATFTISCAYLGTILNFIVNNFFVSLQFFLAVTGSLLSRSYQQCRGTERSVTSLFSCPRATHPQLLMHSSPARFFSAS